MDKFLKSRLLRSMIPYFILGIGLLVAHRLISEFTFFTGEVQTFFGVVTPFVTGAIVAYVLDLPCAAFERLIARSNYAFLRNKARPLAVVYLSVMTVLLLSMVFSFVVPALTESVALFVNMFDQYEAQFMGWVASLEEMNLPAFLPEINEAAVLDMVAGFVDGLDFDALFAAAVAGLGGAAMAVFNTIITIISSIYFLLEKHKIKAFAARLFSAASKESTYATMRKYVNKLNHNFNRYIVTQTIDGVILGTIMVLVLHFVFRSPYALLLGIILGVINYVPYFGSIIGTSIAIVVIAFTQGIPTAGVATIVLFIIQQIDGNVIQPRLMGGSFSLSPLLIIISVTVGGFYAGVLGMLVAIPIVAILKDLLDEYIVYMREKKGRQPDPGEMEFLDREFM